MKELHRSGDYIFDVIEPVDIERPRVNFTFSYMRQLSWGWMRSKRVLATVSRWTLLSKILRSGSRVVNSIELVARAMFTPYPLAITSKLSPLDRFIPERTKLVLYFTELTELDHVGSKKDRVKLFERYDIIVVATGERASLLAQYVPDTGKVFVIENCPSITEVWAGHRDFKAPMSILYQGRVSENFGGEELIQLIEEIAGRHRITIAGPIDSNLLSRIEGLNRKGWVSYVGYLPREKLAELRRSSDVGLLCWNNGSENTRLSAPNKLYEYMASGLVVVSICNFSADILNRKYGFGFVALEGISGISDFLDSSTEDDFRRFSLSNTNTAQQTANYEHQSRELVASLL